MEKIWDIESKEYKEEVLRIEEEAKRSEADKKAQLEHYTAKRAEAYPSVGDQLDALMKYLAVTNDPNISTELKTMANECMEVKERFPKPETEETTQKEETE